MKKILTILVLMVFVSCVSQKKYYQVKKENHHLKILQRYDSLYIANAISKDELKCLREGENELYKYFRK